MNWLLVPCKSFFQLDNMYNLLLYMSEINYHTKSSDFYSTTQNHSNYSHHRLHTL